MTQFKTRERASQVIIGDRIKIYFEDMKRDYLLSCSGATMHSTNIRRRDNSRESRGRARSCYPEMERTNSLSRFPFRGVSISLKSDF